MPLPDKRSFVNDLREILAHRREVWRLVERRHKLAFLLAVGVSAVVSATVTAIAVLLGRFFQQIADMQGRPTAQIIRFAAGYLLLLALLYIVKESLQLLRRYLVTSTATRLEKEFTTRLVSHLLMVDLSALSRERLGALQGRISRSVEGFVKFLKLSFIDFIPAVMTALFALATGLYKDIRLGLVMAGVIPTALVITILQMKSQKGIRLELLRAKEGLDGTLVEQLGGIEYIRAANTHRRESQRIAAAAEARRTKELRHHTAMSLFDWLKSLNEGLFHIVVISFGIYLAASGRMQFGTIFTFSLLFTGIMGPLREVHRILDEAYESSIQVSVLLSMLKEPVDRSFGTVTQRQPILNGTVPLIEAENLCIDYPAPDGTTRRVINGINVQVRHGETIGVAGPSGSGKSTWLRAVMRLIHPSAGQVSFGGVPIDVLSREDIGRLVGYVSQIPFVFAGTVRENIAYGMDGVTSEQIEAAARMAYIHEEIMAMPAGYETVLTERGGNLSGGQRQRIALARVFLRNPAILILDEGTSALDNISERKIQAAIGKARQERTVIMVAHRLSTLRDADRILVFDRGRIAEEGVYETLVAQQGVFAELARSAEESTA
ncbi:MAG TPA: ABC transporter ATP-binding protein [Tepidisphaeraceae bacterium]|jgi:ATP-binding cassette subfamily B protein|nr:ABC transporter ATP-binding protein [Tepidisphaeraceae bacterium]